MKFQEPPWQEKLVQQSPHCGNVSLTADGRGVVAWLCEDSIRNRTGSQRCGRLPELKKNQQDQVVWQSNAQNVILPGGIVSHGEGDTPFGDAR
jgi:hypothetical protein